MYSFIPRAYTKKNTYHCVLFLKVSFIKNSHCFPLYCFDTLLKHFRMRDPSTSGHAGFPSFPLSTKEGLFAAVVPYASLHFHTRISIYTNVLSRPIF